MRMIKNNEVKNDNTKNFTCHTKNIILILYNFIEVISTQKIIFI